jgi:hypothetical protein
MRHGYLHNVVAANGNHDAKRAALDLAVDLDLRRPVNHAGRNSIVIWGVNRQGCRFSRPAPWMARGGGPPKSLSDYGHTEPGRGAEWWGEGLLLTFGWAGIPAFPKVSRRKGGTIGSRYRSNGYVPCLIQKNGRPKGRHREQAPSHILPTVCQLAICESPSTPAPCATRKSRGNTPTSPTTTQTSTGWCWDNPPPSKSCTATRWWSLRY